MEGQSVGGGGLAARCIEAKMTPRNQMYSVLTRRLFHWRATGYIFGFIAGFFVLYGFTVAEMLATGPHNRATARNALTYEDGLALANGYRGLLKEAKEPDSEIEAMVEICRRESSFNPKMQNPTSTSSGLYGFLDSTYRSYGGKTDDPLEQTRMAWYYVWDRYGTAERALAFHRRNGYY